MVLLVDDDPVVASAIRETFDGYADINFHYCDDPGKTVQVAKEIRPTVILLDMLMPQIGGITVLRYLRADPETKRIPVVVLSTKEDAARKAEVFENGGNDYLIKLPDAVEMLARIRYHSQYYQNLLQRDEAYHALRVSQGKLADSNLQLQRMVSSDGLTGIANRRCFDESLEIEWRRSIRSQDWVSVILIDVDFFKACNDTYGHLVGDEILQRVAAALMDCVRRPADLVARYGGDEFVVMLSATDTEGASRLAEKIRASVEALQLKNKESSVAEVVTITLGVAAALPVAGSSPLSILELADRMLYRAKQDGRNCVCVAPAKED